MKYYITIFIMILLLFFKFLCLEPKVTISNFNKIDNYISYIEEDKVLVVENLNNEKVFEKKLTNSFTYKPLIFNDKIFFSDSNNSISCWNLKTKTVLWTQKTPNVVKNIVKLNNKTILINVKSFGIIVLNSENGKVVYKVLRDKEHCHIPDLSPYPIVVDDDSFYISNWDCNSISSFNISDGKLLWSKSLENGIYTSLIYEDYIFSGFNDSYDNGGMYLIEKKTGKVVFKKELLFEERLTPVIKESKIYFYTYDKKLYEFDIKTKMNKIVSEFTSTNDISGGQLYLIEDNIYFQDSNFDVFQLNLTSYKKELVGKSDFGGIEGVYKKENNDVMLIFPDHSSFSVKP